MEINYIIAQMYKRSIEDSIIKGGVEVIKALVCHAVAKRLF